MDFADNSFDFVIARMVLEHLPNPLDAVKEVYRVLKTAEKGVFIDNDFDMHLRAHPDIAELTELYEAYCRCRVSDGGNPRIGREFAGSPSGSGILQRRSGDCGRPQSGTWYGYGHIYGWVAAIFKPLVQAFGTNYCCNCDLCWAIPVIMPDGLYGDLADGPESNLTFEVQRGRVIDSANRESSIVGVYAFCLFFRKELTHKKFGGAVNPNYSRI